MPENFVSLYAPMLTAALPAVQIVSFVILLALRQLPGAIPERLIFSIVCGAAALSIGIVAVLGVAVFNAPGHLLSLTLGEWYAHGGQHFTVAWLIDPLAISYALFSLLLVGTVAVFSRRYLHREEGFHRFYLLLNLFMLGVTTASMAASLDMLIIGWELVGIASFLLIAFFNYRPGPVRNAFWVFCVYRFCDLGLFAAILLMHSTDHQTGFTALANAGWTGIHSSGYTLLLGGLLIFSMMGKSALFPFSGWLPRAMEGPTPSSAIFYGAVSVHLGPLLLLRSYDLIAAHPALAITLIVLGGLTALLGAWVGHTQTDIKSVLAYGSVMQLGIIVLEIGLGFPTLALIHCIGHGFYRTLHILKSPNLLYERQELEQMLGRHIYTPEASTPATRWQWLSYRVGLERAFLDTLLRDYLLRGLLAPVRMLDRLERRLTGFFAKLVEKPELIPAPSMAVRRDRFLSIAVLGWVAALGILLWHAMLPGHAVEWKDWLLAGLLGGTVLAIRFTPAWQAGYATLSAMLLIAAAGCGLLCYPLLPHLSAHGWVEATALGVGMAAILGLPPFSGFMLLLFERMGLGLAASVVSLLAVLLFNLLPFEQAHSVLADELLAGSAVVASLLALVQMHPRRALAYLVASQLALLTFAFNSAKAATHLGGEMMLLAFLTATIGLVMLVSALEMRRGSLSLLAPSGSYESTPRLAMLLFLFGFIGTGLPLSLGYAAEELILGGSFLAEPVPALLWLASITLNAVTVCRMFLYLCQGSSKTERGIDLKSAETVLCYALFLFLAVAAVATAKL